MYHREPPPTVAMLKLLSLARSFVRFFLLVKLTKLTGSQYTSCDAAHARN